MPPLREREIRVKLTFDASDFRRTAKTIDGVLGADAQIRQGLRKAVIRSIVRNIRQRFLQHAEVALEMETVQKTNDPTLDRKGPRQRYRNTRLKAQLNDAFDNLAEAQASYTDSKVQALRDRATGLIARLTLTAGETAKANVARGANNEEPKERRYVNPQKELGDVIRDRFQYRRELGETQAQLAKLTDTATIRKRISALQERLSQSQQLDTEGNRIKPHELSEIRGAGMFRQRMMELLGLFTDYSLLEVFNASGGLAVGIGHLGVVEGLKTPSATQALTGSPTSSRRNIFWRHLEFGTGMFKKKDGNPGGTSRHSAEGFAGAWRYGDKKKGIVAKGTRPMNFITDGKNRMYPADEEALTLMINELLDGLLSRTAVILK